MTNLKEKVLRFLEDDCRFSAKNISDALGINEQQVADIIAECIDDGTILAYKALINWDKTEREYVSAMIEIKVQPEKGEGFDTVARHICAFEEVVSVFLMSGGFDLAVMLEGKSMREVALFVVEKLAVIDGVTGTATHFVLNKYKDKGVIFGEREKDTRVMTEF